MSPQMIFTQRSFFILAPLIGAYLLSSWVQPARAATIDRAKGRSAIVVYDDGEAVPSVGDKLFALENGKKKAILEVKEVKGKKAKVSVRKGQALPGMEVQSAPPRLQSESTPAPSDPGQSAKAADSSSTKKRRKKSPVSSSRQEGLGAKVMFSEINAGATASYAMNSQVVALPTGNQNMSGSGFGFRAFADIPVVEWLSVLGRGGFEQFNVQGGSVLGSAGKTEIMYAIADLLGKIQFDYGDFRPFLLGGLGLHFPISKSSNVLSVNAISATTVFIGGAGFNYAVSDDMYLQMSAEYGMFPPSNEVTTSSIAIRAGLGFAL